MTLTREQIRSQSAEILKRSVTRPFLPDDYPAWEKVAESAWGLPQINRPWDFTALTKDSIASPAMFDGSTLLGGSLNVIKVDQHNELCLLVHMLGVNADYQGIGIGKRLMEANYSLIQNGQLGPVDTIKLTSDPFDTRNAHFYLHNNRMHSDEYIPDAYKGLSEEGGTRHKGLPSDRLYYAAKPNSRWVKEGVTPGTEQINRIIQQSPQILNIDSSTPIVLIETPQDYIALKERSMEEAFQLQEKQAHELSFLFSAGYTAVDHVIVGEENKHHYIVCMKNFNEEDPNCLINSINSLT